MKRLHVLVEGRVQGVGFRDYVQEKARSLGVHGWVRNRADGRLEVLAEGEDVALSHLELLLEKGPPLSRIDEVKVEYGLPTGEFTDFRVTR